MRFPDQIRVQTPVECIGTSNTLKETLSCESDTETNIVSVTIDLPGLDADSGAAMNRRRLYTGAQNFELSISKVLNSVTTEPSDQF